MNRLIVAPIVEGHGEVAAVPILLRRLWYELLDGEFIEVLKPIRQPKDRLTKDRDNALTKALGLAAGKLKTHPAADVQPLILLLLDANGDPPCQLGPELLAKARQIREDQDIICVIANIEYETWFVAAAASLDEYLERPAEGSLPEDPEADRNGKGWIAQRFKGTKYSETVDQPRLTAKFDLQHCREHAPSFDKLCRELEKRAIERGT